MKIKQYLSLMLLGILLSPTTSITLAEKPTQQKHYNAPLHNLVNSICQVVVDTQNESNPHLMTGFFFKEDKDYYYIMTAGHGFTGAVSSVMINLYYEGHTMVGILCEPVAVVLTPKTMRDYAILKISKKALDKYPPPHILPIDNKTSLPQPGSFAFTWGCARGEWPVGMKVRVEKTFRSDRINIHPNMVGGMSGSPVVNDKGELVGMILWQNGYCVSVKELAKFVKKVFGE